MGRSAQDSYILTDLDLYDWGAFSGRHHAPIDAQGCAIVGSTGSGKTTLIDALMTLIVARPRYNLASTGGHESDRDLVSYVRGVTGSEQGGQVLRPGAVVTGMLARFARGDSAVRIGALFWFDGSSSAMADLRRRWLFSQDDDISLDELLETHQAGGANALRELERRSPGLRLFTTQRQYMSRLRSYFEVGENAFVLLNRAAGLKHLHSIDNVFRELVLDDNSAFDGARNVVDEFDTLAGIRAELETARLQRDALLPIAKAAKQLAKVEQDLGQQRELARILPIWFAEQGLQRWQDQAAQVRQELAAVAAEQAPLKQKLGSARAHASAMQTAYLKVGGHAIEQLRSRISDQQVRLTQCQRAAGDYQAMATALGLDDSLTATAVAQNRHAAAALKEQQGELLAGQQQSAYEHGARLQTTREHHTRIATELDDIRRRPGSNVPPAQQQFRSALAAHLELDEETLPFVAELVQVKAAQQHWRGAIERAIGGERLRLLVPSGHIRRALDWVQGRHHRLHVRLHEATEPGAPPRFLDAGYTHKLNFKAHPLREALKTLLARIDRTCVDSVETLQVTPHAMTEQGLMSGRRGYFDKQDQRRLQDDWMTGFDNRDRLAALQRELADAVGAVESAKVSFTAAQQQAEDTRRALQLIDRLEAARFEDIDVAGTSAALDGLREELQLLSAPDSDASLAQARWQQADDVIATLEQQQTTLEKRRMQAQLQEEQIDKTLHQLQLRRGSGLDDDGRALANAGFDSIGDQPLEQLDQVERERAATLTQKISRLTDRQGSIEKDLIRDMGRAKAIDTGALVEVGSDLQDVPAYVTQLKLLQDEALPEKLDRFLTYLNQSSDQGVTQVLSGVDNEVAMIEERIEALNVTLRRVDFQPGCYLRLEPQRVVHESLNTLRRARARLRAAQLQDDQGESHYRALQAVVDLLRDAVERRKTQGALALLDPRYRLQFSVPMIAREDGRELDRFTSSQGGSGGEKEIIASYVLTASLSYALCPPGRQQPLFATVVLDEAFSKSSQAVAGRIIRALDEFGLHTLFVTPNKELPLLRAHTRSALIVHRRGAQATLTSMTWEALRELEERLRGTTNRPATQPALPAGQGDLIDEITD